MPGAVVALPDPHAVGEGVRREVLAVRGWRWRHWRHWKRLHEHDRDLPEVPRSRLDVLMPCVHEVCPSRGLAARHASTRDVDRTRTSRRRMTRPPTPQELTDAIPSIHAAPDDVGQPSPACQRVNGEGPPWSAMLAPHPFAGDGLHGRLHSTSPRAQSANAHWACHDPDSRVHRPIGRGRSPSHGRDLSGPHPVGMWLGGWVRACPPRCRRPLRRDEIDRHRGVRILPLLSSLAQWGLASTERGGQIPRRSQESGSGGIG
jgi:hypothetical protein